MTPDAQALLQHQPQQQLEKPNLCILGVDPGLRGALAFYFTDNQGFIAAEHMPVVAGKVTAAGLVHLIAPYAPDMAVIESVNSLPREGVTSAHSFGRSCGIVEGVVAALKIPYHLVPANKWKKFFGLNSDKEASRAKALQLWPARAELFMRKKDEARAEAALLALYGARVLIGEVPEVH